MELYGKFIIFSKDWKDYQACFMYEDYDDLINNMTYKV